MTYKAVLFDMDGTILDTIIDMRYALNLVLDRNHHKSDFSIEDVNHFFGCGIQVAMTRALAIAHGYDWSHIYDIVSVPEEQVEEIDTLSRQWKEEYALHREEHTKPYEGIVALCNRLKKNGIKIGVISNKPDDSVQSLAYSHFGDVFDFVLGERDDIKRKPAIDMIAKACELLEIDPDEICYVGDSEVDFQTARNFGCDIISVTWGFRNREFLESLHPDYVVTSINELQSVLLLQKYTELVRPSIENLFSQDSSGHDMTHLERTMRLALTISHEEGGNPFLIGLAAFMHDVHRIMQNDLGHFVSPVDSLEKIREILSLTDLTEEEKEQICFSIAHHEEYNWNGNMVSDINTLILQDADNLDAIGAIGVGRSFSYGGSHNMKMYDDTIPLQHTEQYVEENGDDASTLHHFTHKLLCLGDNMNTKTAYNIAQHRKHVIEDFYHEFLDEWEGRK